MGSATRQLDDLRVRVDGGLAAYLDRALPRLVGLHGALEPLADELRAFVLGGGKRIRPSLLLVGHRAAGGDVEAVLGPALALELLHTCALLHDDIIDAAPTRRGRPTTHRTFAARHAEAGWSGDGRQYGEAVAILLGDLAFVQADELFLEATVPPDRLLAGLRMFCVLREEVMAGQYLDLHAAASRTTSVEVALTVATMKSARYSVARPLQLGAVLAGGSEELVAGLGRVGEPLGRAFQVRDDLLGVFGSEDETGKSAASDLAEGKRTLLVAEAAERLDPAGRDELEDALGDPGLDAAGAQRVRELLVRSGGRDAAEAYVERAVAEALDELERLPVVGETVETLQALARLLTDRRA